MKPFVEYRWDEFSSKLNGPYTQLFLTHIDAEGNSTPPVVLDRFTAPERAANIPEFVNQPANAIREIRERMGRAGVADKGRVYNSNLFHALELENLVDLAEVTVAGALARQESLNGLHCIEFLLHLLRVAGGRLLVIWDGSPIHRRAEVKEFVARTRVGCGWRPCRVMPPT